MEQGWSIKAPAGTIRGASRRLLPPGHTTINLLQGAGLQEVLEQSLKITASAALHQTSSKTWPPCSRNPSAGTWALESVGANFEDKGPGHLVPKFLQDLCYLPDMQLIISCRVLGSRRPWSKIQQLRPRSRCAKSPLKRVLPHGHTTITPLQGPGLL